MTYEDYDVLWEDFAMSKFFALEELSIDIIEAFRNGFGGNSHGCKEFETNYIVFDAKICKCTYDKKTTSLSVTVSGKNRCVYLISNNGMPWREPIKLDYANKPFNLSTNPKERTINIDGLSMVFEKAYAFNMTSMLIKYSEMMQEAKGIKPVVRIIDGVEPFYIDNRIRLMHDIDLKQVYAQYVAQNQTLRLTLSEIKYQKFNEYGDVEYGGKAELYCAVPTAEEMLELTEENAKWHHGENPELPYSECLEWASDYLVLSTSVTSTTTISEYEVDKWNENPSFGIREHLFECKNIYGSVKDLRIFVFRDSAKSAGMQFDFNDYRQYYLFGEYLLIMKSNYQKVLRTLAKLVAESEDTTGKIKCPVCGAYNEDGANVCRKCLFDDLSPVFLNRDDAINWEQEVVAPYREKYTSGKIIQFRRE